MVAHPFLRGPSLTEAKAAFSCAEALFFRTAPPLRKQAFDGAAQHEKSAQLLLSAFALVVIRLERARLKWAKLSENK